MWTSAARHGGKHRRWVGMGAYLGLLLDDRADLRRAGKLLAAIEPVRPQGRQLAPECLQIPDVLLYGFELRVNEGPYLSAG